MARFHQRRPWRLPWQAMTELGSALKPPASLIDDAVHGLAQVSSPAVHPWLSVSINVDLDWHSGPESLSVQRIMKQKGRGWQQRSRACTDRRACPSLASRCCSEPSGKVFRQQGKLCPTLQSCVWVGVQPGTINQALVIMYVIFPFFFSQGRW